VSVPISQRERSSGVRLIALFAAITALSIVTHKGGVLVFATALLFSIGLHEFGHFITAKKFGIKVEQFFIGFGPKLWSVRKGETEYGVKALPLGGFVRIAGMNPFEEIPPEDVHRVFKAKRPWKRAIVLAAGSFTHFLLALVIVALTFAIGGEQHFDALTTIEEVQETFEGAPSPAVRGGVKPGDQLVAIDGVGVTSWEQGVELIHDRGGKRAVLTVARGSSRVDLTVDVADHKPDGTKVGFIGISPALKESTVKIGVLNSIGRAGTNVGAAMWESLKGIKNLFSPTSLNRLFNQVVGRQERERTDPATIVGLAGQAGQLARAGDYRTFILTIAAFNVFIGVANLLPLPPLDGGHLAVLAYEKVSRRDVDMRRLLPLTAAVISVFSFLFMMLLYLDIVSPVPPIPG
jgi:membrane-associated protease RseP (regulator of RpoE activity)